MTEYQKELKLNPNFLQRLNIKNLSIKRLLYNEKNRNIIFECGINGIDCINEMIRIEEEIQKEFGDKLSVKIKNENFLSDLDEEQLKDIVDIAIKKLKNRNAISKMYLSFYKTHIREENIYIELNEERIVKMLISLNVNEKLENILSNFGVSKYKIKFIQGDLSKEFKDIESKIENDILSSEKELEKVRTNKIKEDFASENKNKTKNYYTNSSKRKLKIEEIKEKAISISDFYELENGETCVLEGEIFSIDSKQIKEYNLNTILLTDKKDSVTTKVFLNKDDKIPLKEGEYVKIKGKVSIDQYLDNEKVLMINTVEILNKKSKKKEDKNPKKMVELHTHSKMSEMVGVTSVEDLIKRANEYGHSHIAITDYSVVHSFPNAYKMAKSLPEENKTKIIFGCEMYMVDDEEPIITNPRDKDILEEEFVVFDIETMGLNSHFNEIIEIGAVKIKNGRIVDRFSQLINPGKNVPTHITELTSISTEMLEDKPKIEEVIPQFFEFVGEAVMVAHNAPFDMGFIKRDIKKYMNIDYNPSVIDTLQMARDLYPDLKKFGLGDLNKVLGLSLEKHHRAVDDSQATANMFLIFLEKYRDNGITKLAEINGAFPVNTKKQSIKNIIVLVKNKTGLKNMYKLVSESHLKYYGNKKARIPKSVLRENREGLLIGSSMTAHFMNSGELVDLYLRNDLKKIEKNLEFYDYIELLPKDAYSELIEKENVGSLRDKNDIEDMNKFFYNLAKKMQKIVVASSNVHYLDPEEAIIRSILLYGSGNVYRENQYKVDNGFYFRTTEEMLEEFSYMGEGVAEEIIIENTNKIADMIEEIKPIPDGFYPPKIENAEKIVKEMTYNKAFEIYGDPLPKIVSDRLERELKAIIGNEFSVLYLSAQKLVKKSLDNGYLVGSRGSVGSSLVAYMMGITEVNSLYPHYICENQECKYSEFIEKEGVGIDLPEKICPKCGRKLKRDGYSIPFEVFMGFNGEKVPDIDLNFSGEYQNEIHRYCEELFGKENVFKAGTISTLAEKNAVNYAKKYCEENNVYKSNAEITRLGKMCEGAKKTTGQHPGGMIVLPKGNSIYEFCPVQRPANDENSDSITTHYDYHVMDEQLVKLDILGHDDPTTIKLLQEYTNVDIKDIPLSDPETIKLFSSTSSLNVTKEEINSEVGTFGIPEFGTPFVREMLIETRPTTFAELVRISGLSHGTDVWLNNAKDFVKSGEAKLSEIITVRDDIMNYLIDQGIEKDIAFKIMEFVRKGKPSKDPENWEKYSLLMKEKKVKDWYIESCRRIKYMFPKGHAVAYVMMAVRIAYFKVHYPLAFYAAFLSRKVDDFDVEKVTQQDFIESRLKELNSKVKLEVKEKNELALYEIIIEMKARNIEFLTVDIYSSDGKKFTLEDGKIRIPLMGITGLGGSAIDNIIRERKIGKFISIEDLKRRTKISQTVVEKLKKIGAIKNMSETNQIKLF